MPSSPSFWAASYLPVSRSSYYKSSWPRRQIRPCRRWNRRFFFAWWMVPLECQGFAGLGSSCLTVIVVHHWCKRSWPQCHLWRRPQYGQPCRRPPQDSPTCDSFFLAMTFYLVPFSAWSWVWTLAQRLGSSCCRKFGYLGLIALVVLTILLAASKSSCP